MESDLISPTRGRTYARAGRTHDLVVEAGTVTARVTGSRSTPYKVTIVLGKLDDRVWKKAIAAMAEKAQFAADLLAGEMPREIDVAFATAGASIFPSEERELRTSCNCPDWANPCKHVAATHYVLGEAIDRDPFLLFELRGRTRNEVLGALRALRAKSVDLEGSGPDAPGTNGDTPVPTVTLARSKILAWDPPCEVLPALRVSFDASSASGGLLEQLGPPAGWSMECSPADLFAPLITGAAVRARRLAMAAEEASSAPGDASPTTEAKKKTAKKKTAKKKTAKKK